MQLWVGALLACAGLVAGELEQDLAAWKKLTAELNSVSSSSVPYMPPATANEWYTVTIADVDVGYMHTTVESQETLISTMEVMDVQVSRGTDTSRMAFETVFKENVLDPADPITLSEEDSLKGGVQVTVLRWVMPATHEEWDVIPACCVVLLPTGPRQPLPPCSQLTLAAFSHPNTAVVPTAFIFILPPAHVRGFRCVNLAGHGL